MMNFRSVKIVLLLASIISLQSCALVNRFAGTKYGEAGSIGGLEAPPELVTPEWDDSLKIPQTSADRVSALETYGKDIDASVAPDFVDVSVRREGDLRWLEAEIDPVNMWPLLRSFWANQGVPLERDEPMLGVMETDWIDDIDSESAGVSGGREFTATRSKYRIRIEREPNAITNIFLSERRSELQAVTEQGAVWTAVATDPETEAEMLVNLMEHVGRSREEALFEVANTQGPRLYIEMQDIDGVPVLVVGDSYSRVWRRTGMALDRAGMPVIEQNRSEAYYSFTVGSLTLPAEVVLNASRYQVHLLSQGDVTLITVHAVENSASEMITAQEARILLQQILNSYQVFRTTG